MAGGSELTQGSVPDARDLKIAEQAFQIKNLQARLKELEQKLAKLEALLTSAAEVKSSKAPVFTGNDSLDRNKTCKKKSRKKSIGRKPAAAKIHLVTDTSKTENGSKRRSTIVTVFASLQTCITNFTLTNMLTEIDRWTTAGVSLFERELAAMKANLPPPTVNPQL